ncbi:uroporphyrinogen-III C-methyltransferase [Pigmentiphaga aceris]|uniref:uroporphyrinogen-III C-methyltransferase n=1 Tax=Pigmentiphaga aceris TaxID=1940612 RepID=A0A5C0AVX0_9BURK|nr:uroporphyrinogen-III C-methyltransferase [Pigmentiphaga aceris]QEI05866.1 uroporphyrinogen-III C-methyltransferase [Pigmentiphaga aceris]
MAAPSEARLTRKVGSRLLSATSSTKTAGSPGTVYLVGAGPGAADLLTVRAARLLERADIVLHDALVQPEVLALAPQARLVPVGKRCGRLSTAQHFINKQLVDAAQHHSCVVRLKGGDPMLFGRAQEEISALMAAGVPVEIVPGVSAAFAASAAIGQSLSLRGVSRSVAFLTPAVGQGETPHSWAGAAVAADTAVLYMAGRQAKDISDGLMAAGVPASRPVVLVESASLPGQRMVPTSVGALPQAAAALGDGPCLILVGEVYAGLVDLAIDADEATVARMAVG